MILFIFLQILFQETSNHPSSSSLPPPKGLFQRGGNFGSSAILGLLSSPVFLSGWRRKTSPLFAATTRVLRSNILKGKREQCGQHSGLASMACACLTPRHAMHRGMSLWMKSLTRKRTRERSLLFSALLVGFTVAITEMRTQRY